jgi:hypothetical protein
MDLREECDRISALGRRKPTDGSRKEVADALSSKWEGLQVTAAKALSAWGDKASVDLIRKSLIDFSKKPAHWAAAGAVADALKPHMRSDDVEWVLDLCLKHSNPHNRFALFGLLAVLPPKATVAALENRRHTAGHDSKEIKYAISLVQQFSMQLRSNSALLTDASTSPLRARRGAAKRER